MSKWPRYEGTPSFQNEVLNDKTLEEMYCSTLAISTHVH